MRKNVFGDSSIITILERHTETGITIEEQIRMNIGFITFGSNFTEKKDGRHVSSGKEVSFGFWGGSKV
jgi:hypothetical protein